MSRILKPDELAEHLNNMRESYQNCSSELGGPWSVKVVMTSGFYNPLGPHHINYLKEATKLGNIWVAVVNGDGAAKRKNGYSFMPEQDRAIIVSALKYVHFVTIWDDGGPYVDGAISLIKPDFFAKGGDRSTLESISMEERAACRKVGCKIVLGVGGKEKQNSSTNILQEFIKQYGHSV